MEENIYKTPSAKLEVVVEKGIEELASRWRRFWASIVDAILISLFTLP